MAGCSRRKYQDIEEGLMALVAVLVVACFRQFLSFLVRRWRFLVAPSPVLFFLLHVVVAIIFFTSKHFHQYNNLNKGEDEEQKDKLQTNAKASLTSIETSNTQNPNSTEKKNKILTMEMGTEKTEEEEEEDGRRLTEEEFKAKVEDFIGTFRRQLAVDARRRTRCSLSSRNSFNTTRAQQHLGFV